jgi:hypothetical protein
MQAEDNVDDITNKFTSLAVNAEKIMFPDSREGVFAPPNKDEWGNLRNWLYTISQPFDFMDNGRVVLRIILFLWWLISSISTLFLFARLANIVDIDIDWFRIALLCFFVFISYWSWVEYFRSQRYSIRSKVIWAILFFLYCILIAAINIKNSTPISNDPFRFWLFYFVLVIPAFTLYYMTAFNLVFMVGWFIKTVFLYIWSYHAPRPMKQIRQLITDKFFNQDSEKPISLLDLPINQICSLRQWADANREGTEKRTLPTFLILALLGLFANTALFSTTIKNFGNAIIQYLKFFGAVPSTFKLSLSNFVLISLVLPIFAALLILVLRAFLSLFRNLVAQNLIIESCIVAEYAVAQLELSKPKKSILARFLDIVISFLN